jgi:hypothetical protein
MLAWRRNLEMLGKARPDGRCHPTRRIVRKGLLSGRLAAARSNGVLTTRASAPPIGSGSVMGASARGTSSVARGFRSEVNDERASSLRSKRRTTVATTDECSYGRWSIRFLGMSGETTMVGTRGPS